MGKRLVITVMVRWCIPTILCAIVLADASAGPRHSKDETSPQLEARQKKTLSNPELKEPNRQNVEQMPARVTRHNGSTEMLQRSTKRSATDFPQKSRHVKRQGKGIKKKKPQAVAKPRRDLTYHGLLEGPARYEPRWDHLTVGAPDPQTPELAHDHFLELDRNRDGLIDPIERAFGRLDMDRDLSKRLWQ